jgi:putative spermidine/putrescine transport system permease protein
MSKLLNKARRNLPSTATLLVTAFFIFLPLIGATEFSLRDGGPDKHSFQSYKWIFEQSGFKENLGITFQVTSLAVILNLLIMVPTVTWLHISGQKYRRLVEVVTILPLIIPVVALATGAQTALPSFLHNTVLELSFMYVVIAMPYSYRALDIGLSGKPLNTYVAAARNLGASWYKVLVSVITPSIWPSVLAALFLTVALSLGEFTLAQLLHWTTFPTWVANVSQENILGATALSIGSLFFAWLLLFSFTFFGTNKIDRSKDEE